MTLARINRLAAPNSVRVAVAAYAAAAAVTRRPNARRRNPVATRIVPPRQRLS